ncbi:hypothetical protein, partial [Halodesulfovibrio aestuarii]
VLLWAWCPVFGGLLIIHQKGEPLIFQEEMSDQVETLTYKTISLHTLQNKTLKSFFVVFHLTSQYIDIYKKHPENILRSCQQASLKPSKKRSRNTQLLFIFFLMVPISKLVRSHIPIHIN